MCVFVCVYVCVCVCTRARLSIYLSVCLPACLPVCLSVWLQGLIRLWGLAVSHISLLCGSELNPLACLVQPQVYRVGVLRERLRIMLVSGMNAGVNGYIRSRGIANAQTLCNRGCHSKVQQRPDVAKVLGHGGDKKALQRALLPRLHVAEEATKNGFWCCSSSHRFHVQCTVSRNLERFLAPTSVV